MGDWFIAALLSMSTVLAVGVLTAASVGATMLDTSLVAAVVAATIGGLIVAILARAPSEIATSAPSTTVIYAALGADLVARSPAGTSVWAIWAAMSLAVVLMGVMLVLAGTLRLAALIKFMPAPVSAGFVTGIGMLVISSQSASILGMRPTLANLHSGWSQIKVGSVAVAAVTLAVLLLLPRFKRLGHPALLAIVSGTLVYYLIRTVFGPEPLGSTLPALYPRSTAVDTAISVWSVWSPRWVVATLPQVLPYAALLALQAIMNAAVTAVTIGNILGHQSDVNRTLRAQGVANVVCGVLGALPISTSAAQSVPAAKMDGNVRLVAAGSAALLLVLVLIAARWLTFVPVAVLASVLLMAGIGMVNQSTVRLIRMAWSARTRDTRMLSTASIAVVVAAAMFWGSVPLALMIGALLAMVLLAIEVSAATRFSADAVTQLGSRRAWPPHHASWLREHRAQIAVFRPTGTLFFGTADQFAQRLGSTPAGTRFCLIDLSRVTTVDATACEIIAARTKKLAAAGITPLLAGVRADSARGRSLVAHGLSIPDPKSAWFLDLDHALEHAERVLLREQWPDVQDTQDVELHQSSLAAGIGEDDLRELRSRLRTVDAPVGPLFHRGDAGSSMYLIEAGEVEIRIAGDEAGSYVRLAAYGPGSIFGEMSLLMSQVRTADAVCVSPTRLLELDRTGLDAIESHSPRLYGALMKNLNVHIAKRLELTTGLVRAFQ